MQHLTLNANKLVITIQMLRDYLAFKGPTSFDVLSKTFRSSELHKTLQQALQSGVIKTEGDNYHTEWLEF